MEHTSTLFIGLDVHKETIGVAYGAEEREAAGVAPGTLGTRQGDSEKPTELGQHSCHRA